VASPASIPRPPAFGNKQQVTGQSVLSFTIHPLNSASWPLDCRGVEGHHTYYIELGSGYLFLAESVDANDFAGVAIIVLGSFWLSRTSIDNAAQVDIGPYVE
jgi:drug/metabolite transporter (DMT)-like permease